jgi:hypothetical protein
VRCREGSVAWLVSCAGRGREFRDTGSCVVVGEGVTIEFTTVEGGCFQELVIGDSPNTFDKIVAAGWVRRHQDWLPVAYVREVDGERVVRDHDFVLGGPRDDPGAWAWSSPVLCRGDLL